MDSFLQFCILIILLVIKLVCLSSFVHYKMVLNFLNCKGVNFFVSVVLCACTPMDIAASCRTDAQTRTM